MIFQIADILTAGDVASIASALAREDDSFTSGSATAGWYVRDIKHNDQAAGPAAAEAIAVLKKALLAHPVFRSAARPKDFVRILVSRYRPGMAYGRHVDDALMGHAHRPVFYLLSLRPRQL
jgi:PKHD-type hydroxylase